MEQREEELIKQHLNNNDELRSLYLEHLELKQKLDQLRHKEPLSPADEFETKRIQKIKLAQKDRMMEILSRPQQSAAR